MRWIGITIAKMGAQPILKNNGNHNGPWGVIHTWDLWGMNCCVNWNRTQPIIKPLNSHNSSCSCKREYVHVVQYNLLRNSSCLINHRWEWTVRAFSHCRGVLVLLFFLQKYFEFQILWSLSSVDFFLSQSNFQFKLEFNLCFVIVLDTLPSQWCRNIFLKIHF